MSFKLLYLTTWPSVQGRGHFRGRRMFDYLRGLASDVLLGNFVLDAEVPIPPDMESDAVRLSEVEDLRPDVIYLEGGIQSLEGGSWRFPRVVLERAIYDGATLVLPDADLNTITHQKAAYVEAASFLGAEIAFNWPTDYEPVHLADLASNFRSHRLVIIDPAEMDASTWLLPAYDGVSRILAGLPVLLRPHESVLATGNRHSTGTMQNDLWIDRVDFTPFATVKALGSGYVVFIAAQVSSDELTDLVPDNLKWMGNLVAFLADEAGKDQRRRAAGKERETSPMNLSDTYLDPKKPFTNELAIRRVIRETRGVLFWYEQHMPGKVLELLAEEVSRERVAAIRLMSGRANITSKVQKAFAKLVKELASDDIEVAWHVIDDGLARQMHARVIFDEHTIWEVPPLNSLLMGSVDSIRVSRMPRDPFLKAFEEPSSQSIEDLRIS